MAAVSIDDFFEKNLVNNLAALLGIDESRIRIVNIVSESGKRKRRSSGDVSIEIEIGDPPLAVNGSSSSNYTGMEIGFILVFLVRRSSLMVNAVQSVLRSGWVHRVVFSPTTYHQCSVRFGKPDRNKSQHLERNPHQLLLVFM